MTTQTTHKLPFIPSYARVRCADDLARVLLAAFPATSTDARRLVSLVIGSVCKFFDEDESVPVAIESHIREVIRLGLSDYLMALASRIGVDLKNAKWTGDVVSDVRMMYTRLIFKLTNDLLDDTHGDLGSRVHSLQRTLSDTQHLLEWISDERLQDQVESAAEAYHVQRRPAVTLDEQEWAMRRKQMAYRRLAKTGANLKAALWGKKASLKKRDEIEEAGKLLAEVKAAVSKHGDGNESDSGVSMGGYGSESDSEGSVWGNDEVGVAL